MNALDSMTHSPKHQHGKRVRGSGAQRRWRYIGGGATGPHASQAAAHIGSGRTVAQWRRERGPHRIGPATRSRLDSGFPHKECT